MFLIDDIINAIGAHQASQQQQTQVQNAQGLMGDVYNQSGQLQNPWVQGGQQSLAQLLQGLRSGSFNTTVNPETIANDPGYQFQLHEAQKALERSAAARGGLNSGAFAKELSQYNQGLAATQFQNAWQRQFQQNQANFSNLYNTAGMGQSSAQSLGALGQGYSNAMAGLYGAMGNAQASGTMGVTQGITGAIKSALGGGLQGLSSSGGGGGGGQGGQGGGQQGGVNIADIAKLLAMVGL